MGKKWKQWQTFTFLDSEITADGDCSHKIRRFWLLGRKAMTNLDSVLKSRDITLLTEVHIGKAKRKLTPLYTHAKSLQSCPTLCDPTYCSPPGSCVHGILQARVLKWVAIPFSRGSSQPKDRTQGSRTAGWFFTSWATREALYTSYQVANAYKHSEFKWLHLKQWCF